MAGTPRFDGPKLIKGFLATEAMAAYRCVVISTDTDFCEYNASQYDAVFGVTLHDVAINKPVDVVFSGIGLVQVDGAAATITALTTMLTSHNATGYAQASAGGAAGLRRNFGMALEGSTVDGDIIPFLFAQGTNYYAS